MSRKFCIVAGAEKAGTTSLHTYLSAHPQVCPSIKKETDYFRQSDCQVLSYIEHFRDLTEVMCLYLESSPGYLAEAKTVAPRINLVVPEAKLIFILRDPIDRLYSSYRFYISRLNLPKEMSFETFVGHCFDYEKDASHSERCAIKPWFLQSLNRGCYGHSLSYFLRTEKPNPCLVINYDKFNEDLAGVIREVAHYLEIDPDFFNEYRFTQENVTFFGRRERFHKLALHVNARYESFFRKNPQLKARARDIYKYFNAASLDKLEVSLDMQMRLTKYYSSDTKLLLELVPRLEDACWINRYR